MHEIVRNIIKFYLFYAQDVVKYLYEIISPFNIQEKHYEEILS